MAKKPSPKTVETLKHEGDKRKNIPTAEFQSVLQEHEQKPVELRYRRNTDLDPQLVWRGKDQQDWSDLIVQASPLYIQEKVHPKVLIDDLLRATKEREHEAGMITPDLFADFNGIAKGVDKTEFYQHDQNWSNRMILGDSLQVMASLAEREALRGKVQCIYFDPPYGIKFNSNFQWSTTSRDVRDGNAGHITREPEQVKAFRDTWRDGIHSYLTYLRDRLTIARDLLTESGSIFLQIGDENVHRVRAVMDEVFGDQSLVSMIALAKTAAQTSEYLPSINDYILWYAKDLERLKYRQLLRAKSFGTEGAERYSRAINVRGEIETLTKETILGLAPLKPEFKAYSLSDLTSQRQGRQTGPESAMGFPFLFQGKRFEPSRTRGWSTTAEGLERLVKASRVEVMGNNIAYRRMLQDFSAYPISNNWDDVAGVMSRSDPKVYVVQTSTSAVTRCILMATDPGDLVLDPTCGSGTTAFVAEQWARRWITIDTSRVALALARARIMGARYPFYLLADSREGQIKEAEVAGTTPSSQPTRGDLRHGFVYERVPHITLKSIANDTEIDVIWGKWQPTLEALREQLNIAFKQHWQEWEIPRVAEDPWDSRTEELFHSLKNEQARSDGGRPAKIADLLRAINHNRRSDFTLQTLPERPADPWPKALTKVHADWWQALAARQTDIDRSIAAKAEFEFLYDKPYDDKKKVRVAGPFTVESLSPHRVLGVDENDELIDHVREDSPEYGARRSFPQMILEALKIAGVQQAHKEDKITFTSLVPWPGDLVCAEGRYLEGETDKRAAIFIGPEFGTVQRADLVQAAREAGDAGFDVLIACAFNYEAHTTEFNKLGRLPVLKARMNADLHMAENLKNTGKGNLFVIFGEPDIDLMPQPDGKLRLVVKGIDVFKPQVGKVEKSEPDELACWFIDTDYNEESFFVRHAYFLGANDPYNALKTTLRAEIDQEAWSSLNSDTSRPFEKPKNGRIAVKVINHLGDEVMKVFRV
jgi:adenine-specific DNA-methyltransferase